MDVGRRAAWRAAAAQAEVPIHLLQRSEEPGEGIVKARGPATHLVEIARAELIGHGDRSRAQGAIFMGTLRPRDALRLVDP